MASRSPMRLARLAPVALLALAACGRAPASAPSNLLGKSVQFDLPSDRGELRSVPPAGAAVTVVEFFGPTCEPCREALPLLVASRDELAAAGAQLVLVAVLAEGEATSDARRALVNWGVPNQSFLVDSGDIAKSEAGVRNLPATLVLDRRGTLRWSAPNGASAAHVVAAARAAQ